MAHVKITSPNPKCCVEDHAAQEGKEETRWSVTMHDGTRVHMSGNPCTVVINSPHDECDRSGVASECIDGEGIVFTLPCGTKVTLFFDKDNIPESFKDMFPDFAEQIKNGST